MLDQISAREWILLGLVLLAYPPARYVVQHIAASPSRRDITLPKEDISWRTTTRLFRSLAILAVLLLSAIFIYTRAAEEFARSPYFFPLLTFGVGGWAFSTVLHGLYAGSIQPFVRGINDTYERASQPKRFWASLAWNTFFGGLCLFVGYQMYSAAPHQTLVDQCYNHDSSYSAEEELAACSQLISESTNSPEELADYLTSRGIIYEHRDDFQRALFAYTEAIRLDPDDYYSHYNRGLLYQELGKAREAATDFTAAIRAMPKDGDAYLQRGLIYLDSGKLDDAANDFTLAHQLRPGDPWPLANRGVAHAWMSERALAEKDFAAARRIDPKNPVLLRGEAIIAMKDGKFELAVERLTASLGGDPYNEWALRTRAYAYERLGEEEKKLDDLDRLWELRKIRVERGSVSSNEDQ